MTEIKSQTHKPTQEVQSLLHVQVLEEQNEVECECITNQDDYVENIRQRTNPQRNVISPSLTFARQVKHSLGTSVLKHEQVLFLLW